VIFTVHQYSAACDISHARHVAAIVHRLHTR
jgi:hypothetical protein